MPSQLTTRPGTPKDWERSLLNSGSCTCLSLDSPSCQNILEQMVQTEMEIVPDLISILARNWPPALRQP